MKSIKQQYIDLKEGKMSQHNFMRSVRMSLPQYITNVTSFNDTVKILKNKGILNEATISSPEDVKEQWFDEFQSAIRSAVDNNKNITDKEAGYSKAMKALDNVDAIDMYGMFQPGPGAVAFVSDIDDILAKAGDEEVNDEDDDIEDIIKRMEDEEYGKLAMKSDKLDKPVEEKLSEDDDEEEAPEDYEDPDMFDAYGMDASEGKLSEGKKKKEPKKELHPNQIHPQELRMGIKVELEHTDSLDKAKKIALDHLAENPFYYTALKLAGVESPSAPKAKAPKAVKKTKMSEPELTDKENAMKPVKGVEKIKASSNKASKETNKVVKGVEELTHNAKTVRGLQKFAATGGKMKAVREGQLNEAGGEYTFTGTLTADEIKELDGLLGKGKYDFNVEEIDDHYETTISHNFYNELNLKDAIDQVTGRKVANKSFRPGVDLGKSFDKFKSTLEEIVREVIAETFDGRDNLDETEGIEVTQDDDQIEISADSGDYVGYVEDNGKVSFSVVYNNTEDIENEFGEEGITEDNWKEVLGSDHAFVQIIGKIGGDVEAASDYVQITVNADKLKNHFRK
jgi:hypothetical protein